MMTSDDAFHCEATGKLILPSRRAALKSRGARRNRGARMRAYFCRHCLGWHLTTQKHTP